MKPSISTLDKILPGSSQYLVPVYQRDYRWEEPQWERFWISVSDTRLPGKTRNHFMGFLVFIPAASPAVGGVATYHMVDGQQRLTTSSIFLAAIRNVARTGGYAALADEIHNTLLVHPYQTGDQHYRLMLKSADHKNYVSIVKAGHVDDGRLSQALRYFERKLRDNAPSLEQLQELRHAVCHRLDFMCATLEQEDVYSIFRSLNSTGVALDKSDLIRNFVFMHVSPEKQDDFDKNFWRPLEKEFESATGALDESRFSSFFRDYLMSFGKYVPPDKTFLQFEARYEDTSFDPEVLAQDLLTEAGCYSMFAGQKSSGDKDVDASIWRLRLLSSPTTYPLLLLLFRKWHCGQIDSAGLVRCINMLTGMIFRRYVCGESSRGYGVIFAKACGVTSDNFEERLKSYLLERGWPDDAHFKEQFTAFPFYQKGYAREMLLTIERFRGHKEPADLSKAQVEHVMPQTLSPDWIEALGADADLVHREWLHRAGNLTLSGYNQELYNYAFTKKRGVYAKSNVSLSRDISEFATWTAGDIEKRGAALAEEAVSIWPGPATPFVPAVGTDIKGELVGSGSLRLAFWTGLAEYLSEEHPEFPSVNPGDKWSVRLHSGLWRTPFEARFAIKDKFVGVDVWFVRSELYGIWEAIRANPSSWNDMVGAPWEFSVAAKDSYRGMSVKMPLADPYNQSSWPTAYKWIGDKLKLIYEVVSPKLLAEIVTVRESL